MKNVLLMMIGVLLFGFVAICPLPTMLAVSGIVWRAGLGLLGCGLFACGIYGKARHQG